jgi:hypothetical protein
VFFLPDAVGRTAHIVFFLPDAVGRTAHIVFFFPTPSAELPT